MDINDIYLLSPELSVAMVAAFVILADLVFRDKRILSFVAVIGLLIPTFFSVALSMEDQSHGFFGAFKLDEFSLFFKYLILGSTATVILLSNQYAKRFENHQGEYYALILLSAAGMMLLASCIELITLYISLELTALPLAALSAFLRNPRSAESGMKFLILSAISSAILLYGMVLIYGLTGTSYLPEIAEQISKMTFSSHPALMLGIILVTAGFGFKISAVPFQMWAPDVYEGAPTPITGFLSVASKAAGFAVILRVFYSMMESASFSVDWANLIAIISVLSMTIGNLIAIRQTNIKRMLAYSTIAQAGYLMVGLAAITTLPGGDDMAGPSGILFYLAGYAMTNLTAFGVIIAVTNLKDDDLISSFSGLGRKHPFLAAALTLSMISLIGIPPTVGFMAKVYIFGSAIDTGFAWLAVAGVINSVISAYYYLRVVKIMFLSDKSSESEILRPSFGGSAAVLITALSTFIFGIYPTPIIELAQNAIQSIVI